MPAPLPLLMPSIHLAGRLSALNPPTSHPSTSQHKPLSRGPCQESTRPQIVCPALGRSVKQGSLTGAGGGGVLHPPCKFT